MLLAVGDRSAESTCVLIRFVHMCVGRWRSFSNDPICPRVHRPLAIVQQCPHVRFVCLGVGHWRQLGAQRVGPAAVIDLRVTPQRGPQFCVDKSAIK